MHRPNVRAVIFNRYLLVVISLFAAIFSSFRILGVGADHYEYVRIFTDVFNVPRPSIEPAYVLIRHLNDFLQLGVWPVYFISVILALFLKINAFTHLSRHYNVVFGIYMCSFFFIHEYTQIRAAVSIGIFLNSINDIVNKNTKSFVFKTFLAIMFHYSAICMLPCYYFVNFSQNKKFYLYIVVIGVFCSFFLTELFSSFKEIIYVIQNIIGLNKSGNESNFIKPWNLKYLVLFISYIYVYTIINTNNIRDYTLFKIMSFGLCCFYYFLPIGLPVITVRFTEFFTVVFVILMVNIAYSSKYLQNRYIYLGVTAIIALLYGYAAVKTAIGL